MIQIRPLDGRFLPAEAAPVLEAEHASAQSILRYIDTLDHRTELIEDRSGYGYDRLFAAIGHCSTLCSVTEMYLRPAHSIAAQQVPIMREGSALEDVAKQASDIIRTAIPQLPLVDKDLNELYTQLRHYTLPQFDRQAKSRQFPYESWVDSQRDDSLQEVKAIAEYMGRTVVVPTVLVSRNLFLTALESRLGDIQSTGALNYFGGCFESSTVRNQ